MELSVVVPTLNGRDALRACLDALRTHVGGEVVVANGPSADGTTGMVRDREEVDVLLELADRSVGVARNAGIAAATGEVIALVDERTVVDSGWRDAVAAAVAAGADVVAGPVRGSDGIDGLERRRIGGRSVTYFDGGNVAFTRTALDRLDGFDEYLDVGGARDAAHRLAALGLRTDWVEDASARRAPVAPRADGGDRQWDWKYRSLAYRLAKNYGVRPTVLWRTVRHAGRDGLGVLREVVAGDLPASRWLAGGRDVVGGVVRGGIDGLRARRRAPGPARNPNGISARTERVIQSYDWR